MADPPAGRQFMFCHQQKYAISHVWLFMRSVHMYATVDTQFINLEHPFKLFPDSVPGMQGAVVDKYKC